MSARDELYARARLGIESAKRTNAMVSVSVGGLFALFALGCFAGAAKQWLIDSSPGAALPVGAFGLVWAALAVGLFVVGLRGFSALKRDALLRTSGLRGWATVLDNVESKFVVDGATRCALTLRIEVDGRAPWDVTRTEYVPRMAALHAGTRLPVFVSAADPTDVMVDWFSRSA